MNTPGVHHVIADYLMAHGLNYVFTISELEEEVYRVTGRHRVEVDRRVRELRSADWVIHTYREDVCLKSYEHKVIRFGGTVLKQKCFCSGKVRRAVFERDGKQCQICGIWEGEPYPDRPEKVARMTVGRIIPGATGGKYTIVNSQVQCSWCNEESRDYRPQG